MAFKDELEQKKWLDSVCSQFEESWSPDDVPDFRFWLKDIESEAQDRLLRELIDVDIELCFRAGFSPVLARYADAGTQAEQIAQELLLATRDFQSDAGPTGCLNSTVRPDETNTDMQLEKVGPFSVLKKLGEGGMGSVWLAEQTEPIRRRVALKVIKSGVGSREILARFDAERQALALMNHPNIARIVDAGTTPDGQPFFAMELVQGLTLTEYCAQKNPGIRERLKLFLDVCAGVQHAHQKGIIHRDLKPSNVLIVEIDNRPVPKVIDFGLAKAMENTQRLTDQSLHTGIGQILGTLKYMSPEQAGLNLDDIDTRTDVYSLGVMLYELLTGYTPLDPKSMRDQPVLRILELIREQEPKKPSSRLSHGGNSNSGTVELRKSDSYSLYKMLAGDLDWVVLKALEKERHRRYDAVSALTADVKRFLDNDPVLARPPSTVYRVKKFTRKHRIAVVSVCSLLMVLLAGFSGTSWGLMRALRAEKDAVAAWNAESKRAESERAAKLRAEEMTRQATRAAASETEARKKEERQRKYAEAISDFVIEDFLALTSVEGQDRFSDSYEYTGLGRKTTLGELLDRAAKKVQQRDDIDPQTDARLNWIIGVNLRGSGYAGRSIPFLETAVNLAENGLGLEDSETLQYMNSLAVGLSNLGKEDEAAEIYEQVFEVRKSELGPQHRATLDIMENLALTYRSQGDFENALPILENVVAGRKALLGEKNFETIQGMNSLARCLHSAGRDDEAIKVFEKALTLAEENVGFESGLTLGIMGNLAGLYVDLGNFKVAIPMLEDASIISDDRLGADHPISLSKRGDLALAYMNSGARARALPMLKAVWENKKKRLGIDHPSTLLSKANYAYCCAEMGDLDTALPLFESTWETMGLVQGEKHPKTLSCLQNYAAALDDVGNIEKSIALKLECYESSRELLGHDHPQTLSRLNNLALGLRTQGELDEAIPLLEESLELTRKVMGENHPRTATSMNNLAVAYVSDGEAGKARPLMEQAIELAAAAQGEHHPETIQSRFSLGQLLILTGKDVEGGLKMMSTATKQNKQFVGPAHPDTLSFTVQTATANLRYGHVQESLPLYEEFIEKTQARLGKSSLDFAKHLTNISIELLKARQFGQAEKYLRQCLEIRSQQIPDSWQRFDTCSLLGAALLGQARVMVSDEDKENDERGRKLFEEAEELVLSGYEGLKERESKLSPRDKACLTEALNYVVLMYEMTDRKDEAKEWRKKR